MKSRLRIVTMREYLGQIKNPVFWISTLAIPFMIVVINLIVFFSNQSAKSVEQQAVANAKIVVVDKSNLVQLPPGDQLSLSVDETGPINRVKQGELDAVIVVPADVVQQKQVAIYQKDTGPGLGSTERYNDFAEQLVKNSILAKLGNQQLIELYNAKVTASVTTYAAEGQKPFSWQATIAPALIGALYLFLVMFSAGTLLTSVSEEKENRAMEIVLTSVTPKQLIWGKILGLTLSGVTQLVVLGVLGAIALMAFGGSWLNAITISDLTLDPLRMAYALFIVLSGYLMVSCLVAAVGALTPTAKDASSLSSVVFIGSFFPFYFVTTLITQPSSLLAYVTSYFPLTAPIVLLARNALGALPPWEMALSALVLVLYVMGALWLATKAFRVGALEYGSRVSFKKLFTK